MLAHRPVDEKGNKPATAASLGYTPEGAMMPWEGRQARHWLQVSEAEDEVKIAHEIGHGESCTRSESELGKADCGGSAGTGT